MLYKNYFHFFKQILSNKSYTCNKTLNLINNVLLYQYAISTAEFVKNNDKE